MRRAAALALAGLSLASCKPTEVKEAELAEQRLAMLMATEPDKAEVCEAKREVERAWLKALDQDKYRSAKSTADIACLSAELEARL